MKKILIIVGLVFVFTFAFSQETKDENSVKEDNNPGKEMLTRPDYTDEERMLENRNVVYVARLTGRLKLTDEQVEAIRPIALERMKLMDRLVKEQEKGRPSKEFMKEFREESKDLLEKINAHLTQEQRAEFIKMQKENIKKIRENKK